jgi:hypothetical protein
MNTQTKKVTMYQQIEKHGNNLNAIFNTGLEPVELCKKLFRLENKAHRLTTKLMNLEYLTDNDPREVAIQKELDFILTKVKNILFARSYNVLREKAIFINYDARGYALKIRSSYISENKLNIHTDGGGYGILAPDFNN